MTILKEYNWYIRCWKCFWTLKQCDAVNVSTWIKDTYVCKWWHLNYEKTNYKDFSSLIRSKIPKKS